MKTINHLEILKQIQKIQTEINEFEKNKPKKPAFFDKKIMTIDTSKLTKADNEWLNTMIRQKWDLKKLIEEEAKVIKKGDNVFYLNTDTNKILEAKVVNIGKYKNDYNDLSGFIRIKNDKYSWNQHSSNIVKK